MKKIVINTLTFLLCIPTFLWAAIQPTDIVYEQLNYEALQQAVDLDLGSLHAIVSRIHTMENGSRNTWFLSYYALSELIEKNNFQVGCEVGVAYGNHSYYILANTAIKKLYSIDPYRQFAPSVYNDPMNLDQKTFNVLYHIVKERLSVFDARSTLLRKTSEEAANLFEDNSLDFMYLDANHSYEAVKHDLEHWYAKIRPGGIIAGDDYGHVCFPGLKRAVDDFFSSKNLLVSVIPQINFYWAKK